MQNAPVSGCELVNVALMVGIADSPRRYSRACPPTALPRPDWLKLYAVLVDDAQMTALVVFQLDGAAPQVHDVVFHAAVGW